MKLLRCPINGLRPLQEFHYGGELREMPDPEAASDAEWADYVFNRTNPRGAHKELWNHAQGCRRWFRVERDTVTYRISGSYRLSDSGEEA